MKFNNLIPLLDVSDVEHSIEFYENALGFSIEDKLVWDGKIDWALLNAGSVRLMLSHGEESSHNDTWALPHNSIFFMYPDDIDHLYQSLKTKGFDTSELQCGQNGAKEFCLQDPDGYVLWFSHKQVQDAMVVS